MPPKIPMIRLTDGNKTLETRTNVTEEQLARLNRQARWGDNRWEKFILEKGYFYGVDSDYLSDCTATDDSEAYCGGITCWVNRETGECFCDPNGLVKVVDLDIEIPVASFFRIKLEDGTQIANPDNPKDTWGR